MRFPSLGVHETHFNLVHSRSLTCPNAHRASHSQRKAVLGVYLVDKRQPDRISFGCLPQRHPSCYSRPIDHQHAQVLREGLKAKTSKQAFFTCHQEKSVYQDLFVTFPRVQQTQLSFRSALTRTTQANVRNHRLLQRPRQPQRNCC